MKMSNLRFLQTVLQVSGYDHHLENGYPVVEKDKHIAGLVFDKIVIGNEKRWRVSMFVNAVEKASYSDETKMVVSEVQKAYNLMEFINNLDLEVD